MVPSELQVGRPVERHDATHGVDLRGVGREQRESGRRRTARSRPRRLPRRPTGAPARARSRWRNARPRGPPERVVRREAVLGHGHEVAARREVGVEFGQVDARSRLPSASVDDDDRWVRAVRPRDGADDRGRGTATGCRAARYGRRRDVDRRRRQPAEQRHRIDRPRARQGVTLRRARDRRAPNCASSRSRQRRATDKARTSGVRKQAAATTPHAAAAIDCRLRCHPGHISSSDTRRASGRTRPGPARASTRGIVGAGRTTSAAQQEQQHRGARARSQPPTRGSHRGRGRAVGSGTGADSTPGCRPRVAQPVSVHGLRGRRARHRPVEQVLQHSGCHVERPGHGGGAGNLERDHHVAFVGADDPVEPAQLDVRRVVLRRSGSGRMAWRIFGARPACRRASSARARPGDRSSRREHFSSTRSITSSVKVIGTS